VNAISPGFLLTNLTTIVGMQDGVPIEAWNALEARQGRSAKFEEIGDVAVLVTSPRMSLVNGVNFFVDG
jgi:NAD(P)-dependent dehydrogenase (short-subunit alcohol dehydrogenase family)